MTQRRESSFQLLDLTGKCRRLERAINLWRFFVPVTDFGDCPKESSTLTLFSSDELNANPIFCAFVHDFIFLLYHSLYVFTREVWRCLQIFSRSFPVSVSCAELHTAGHAKTKGPERTYPPDPADRKLPSTSDTTLPPLTSFPFLPPTSYGSRAH